MSLEIVCAMIYNLLLSAEEVIKKEGYADDYTLIVKLGISKVDALGIIKDLHHSKKISRIRQFGMWDGEVLMDEWWIWVG